MYNTKSIYIMLLHFFLFILTFTVFAQDSSFSHQSVRLEIGGGLGIVGKGEGFSGRLAISYHYINWGGVIRISAHDGGEGTRSGWFGPPKEKFYDSGILLSYSMSQSESWQIIASIGVGLLFGERLTKTEFELEDFDPTIGFAYELGIASSGSTFGWSLIVMGNINSVSNLVAIILSLSIVI